VVNQHLDTSTYLCLAARQGAGPMSRNCKASVRICRESRVQYLSVPCCAGKVALTEGGGMSSLDIKYGI
jgi:hypothetical protein